MVMITPATKVFKKAFLGQIELPNTKQDWKKKYPPITNIKSFNVRVNV